MPVKVACPSCSKRYRLREARDGVRLKCQGCGHTFTVSTGCSETHGAAPTDTRAEPVLARAAPLRTANDDPTAIGRFRIRLRLGSGAFGTVYRAFDPVLNREVALKVPVPGALQSAEARERFAREPKAAAQLRHPHIVPVYDAGVDGAHFYIASAYIAGETLEAALARRQFDVREAAAIIRKLADALQYAHAQGIIHRDVKPANIMIDPQGEPHLMDFGLARLEQLDEKLTQDGALMGTPAYMSPEQAGADVGEVGPASDQYSLGVVLYELLCGARPFEVEGNVAALLYQIREHQPDRLRSRKPDRPSRPWRTICLKAIAKEPGRRYSKCAALANDLRRWQEDEPIHARRVGPTERLVRWCRRNPVMAGLATSSAALLILVALVSAVGYAKTRAALADAQAQRKAAQAQKTTR